MTRSIDEFFTSGCGRCAYFDTPQCKIHVWRECLMVLRDIALSTGLEEQMKWGFPCYTQNGKNVIMLGAFKGYCSVAFFKGSLLTDTHHMLSLAGENSQSSRQIRFTSLDEIANTATQVEDYIRQAIDVEKSGAKVMYPQQHELVFPEELLDAFETEPGLEQAFRSLTTGRQRGYILFFSSAKQSATRASRIQKWIPSIRQGKGMQD